MTTENRPKLVLAIYLQTRGFAFVLFKKWPVPVDWAVHDIRGADKNERCVERVKSIFTLHTPDVVVLQEMPERDTRRALRIRRLNRAIQKLAQDYGIAVRLYPRAALRESFASTYGATTKQTIAETIAKHVPAFDLYVPPARKAWIKLLEYVLWSLSAGIIYVGLAVAPFVIHNPILMPFFNFVLAPGLYCYFLFTEGARHYPDLIMAIKLPGIFCGNSNRNVFGVQ